MDETDISMFEKRKSQREKTNIAKTTRISVSNSLDEEYSNCKKVGIALIFNHEQVYRKDPRNGTNGDRDRLRSTLKLFGFDVRVFNNFDLKNLKDALKRVALEDHSENDCLLIVVMSHGSMGEVCAQDTTYPVDSLWEPFLGDKCPSLFNKPRMIFIEACRGEGADLPVSYRPMSAEGQTEAVDYSIPTSADLLVFYSSFDGHTSFLNSETGSWFIQSICVCLEKAAANSPEGTEILPLLIHASRKVAYEYVSNCVKVEFHNTKEMPTIVSTLTKIFYLKVKKGIKKIYENKRPQFPLQIV